MYSGDIPVSLLLYYLIPIYIRADFIMVMITLCLLTFLLIGLSTSALATETDKKIAF